MEVREVQTSISPEPRVQISRNGYDLLTVTKLEAIELQEKLVDLIKTWGWSTSVH